MTFVSRKDIDKVMPPRLQGGNPPDVSMVDSSLVQLWGDVGFLADLGTDSEWYSKLNPGLRDIMTSGDEMYVLPLEVIGMGNFVNLDLLAQVGIENVPLTVEDTKAACTALAAADISPMIFSGTFPAMLWVGANGIDPNGTAPGEYGSGAVTFEGDPAFEGSLDSVRDLVDSDCFDPKLQAGLDPWSTALEEFKAGRVAMLPQGAWNIGSFSKIEGLNFAFAPMPSRFAEVGLALDLVGPGWSIPRDAKNKEAARKWVDFFARDDVISVFLAEEGAYNPFTGGTDGLPELAALYGAARDADSMILWPFSTLEFPKQLQFTWEESLTGFLLNLDAPNSKTLERWDEAVEDSL
ncbi:extracellular solute-binding protein [Phaeobacter sp. J2-8]|uniref:ABC transporter substrate-binding protein n=1 Tax=Phaeobacter sp. J2-8 TaxID=2931394 RepID=UPI001FD37121|nr:extracellular solute-binding protein [Phaeobacter sp. J2-8]MCJ7874519.1 extracellular solute-binding protein [Phaeobacter sp. J2-8]